MAESRQHTLDRVRSPRVHITYDVETGGAIEKKEIPFVVGVIGDYSGKPDPDDPDKKKFKNRKFVEIDRDNFNSVLKGMKPRLAFRVDNKLSDEDTKIPVELKFESLDDFHPEQVAKQISPVNKLVDARQKLTELLGKLDGNDKLDELLQGVINETDKLQELSKDTGEEKKGGENAEEKKDE
jgi:type VI secretion system protein ImpB